MLQNHIFKVSITVILFAFFCTGKVTAASSRNLNDVQGAFPSPEASKSARNIPSFLSELPNQALMGEDNIIRVSVASDGTQANNASRSFSVSGDGRYVVFTSDASNLVDGDTNGVTDIFLRDTQARTTTRIAPGYVWGTDISADGRYVVFASEASNLVDGDTNGKRDVFRYDTQTKTITRVSIAPDGTQWTDRDSSEPSISDNGRFVTFYTTTGHIYLRDIQSNT